MRENEFNDLKERAWRRRLNPNELEMMRKFLAGRPEAVEEIEREDRLSRLLEQMATVPVSSNFTARILANVRDEKASRPESANTPWVFRSWWVRFAAGAAMVCAGFVSFQEFATAHRTQEAREVAAASQMAAVPPIEWLNDFDTIDRLDKVKLADDDLLSVLE
jgi:anti-sigma factor RsiW